MSMVIDYKGMIAALSHTYPDEWREESRPVAQGGLHYLYHNDQRKLSGEAHLENGYFEVGVYGDDMEVSCGARVEDLPRHRILASFVLQDGESGSSLQQVAP